MPEKRMTQAQLARKLGVKPQSIYPVLRGLALFTKVAIPMMLYRSSPSPARRKRFLRYVLTTPDDGWADYLGDAFPAFRMDFPPPRLLRNDELARFMAPVQVIGAEDDLSIPGEALLARAKRVFPNPAHSELLAGSRHCPPTDPTSRKRLTATVGAFLAAALL